MKFPRLSLLVPTVAAAGALSLLPDRASAETAYGLTSTSQLISFDTSNPSGAFQVGTLAPTGGQQIVGIDFQPSSFGGTPTLYALGYNSSTNFVQLYTVNLSSGALTTFGTGQQLGTGTSGSTNAFGFDFNPSSGGIRIIASSATSTGQNNFRFNATGTTLTTDTSLAYAAGDSGAGQTPQIVGAAYTNNFAGTPTTTLYGYDFNRDALVTVGSLNGSPNSPNGGMLNTVSLFASGFAQTSAVGFDISRATGTGFLSAQNLQGQSVLYSIAGLAAGTPGTPTALGNFGAFNVTDFSVIPEPGSVALSALGLGALVVAIRRRKQA